MGGDGRYRCWARNEVGSICGAFFHSKVALTSHFVHARGGEHGAHILGRVACVSNRCIICGTCYSSCAQAQKHMANSMEKGI
eukprot:8997056-Pyramimonas_sp.AAC.1